MSKAVASGEKDLSEGAILSRLEMTSALYFQRVTAISNRFRVSIRNLKIRSASGDVFLFCGGVIHF